jgi:hypothetical protein
MGQSARAFAGGAVAVWVLLVAAVATVAAAGAPDDPSAVWYRGRVLDTFGGRLPGVYVYCIAGEAAAHRATTDDKGEYVFASTTGACERIVFDVEGFVSERFAAPSAGVLDVTLVLGFAGERVWVKGAGQGFVVNADGSPAVDATVWLWRIGGAAPGGWRTDAAGSFSLPFNDGGEFVLCARGNGEHQRTMCQPMTTDPFPGGTVRLRLPPQRSK